MFTVAQVQQRSLSSQRRRRSDGGAELSAAQADGRRALLDACKAADSFLLPLQAAVTPAAALLRPLATVFAPCSAAAAPDACRRMPPGRQKRT